MIIDVPSLKESSPVRNGAQGSLFHLTKEEYEEILALEDISPDVTPTKAPETYSPHLEHLKVKKLGQLPEVSSLYFENPDSLFTQIATALKNGKHIILNGPPGTGKSKLAKEICKFYKGNKDGEKEGEKGYIMTTATSDWSTFDTIGGLMPAEEKKLEFNKGIFLRCFQNDEGKPDNKWLILDEINRADIDKAFGSLFSALTGDNITLAQKIHKNPIEIIGDPGEGDEVENHKFFIHPDWRIIATMNTFDKASLYEMSYAFMRRFAFINVGVP
ncbi:MAG: AAA family ATPase, partial [Thermoplasmata archaeon]|nr:AAA family ATPase [Thermoplasmata archaeon]